MSTRKFGLILSSLLFASFACQTVVAPSATPPYVDPNAAMLDSVNATATAIAAEAPARATQAAEDESAEATLAALNAIAPDLEMLGFSPEMGRLDFTLQDPLSISADLPNFYFYYSMAYPDNPVYRNFVLGVDVEWESKTGLAGCGIIVRAENDLEMGEQVHFRTLRLSGLPGWTLWQLKYNEIKGVLTGDMRINAAINQEAGSTNHYVLEVIDETVTVYANGTKLGSGSMTVNRSEGQIAFYTWQESGESRCTFSNAWVWEIPPYSDSAPVDQEGGPAS